VSLAIGTNPAGGTLSGGSAVTVASGIATFSGLSIDTAGTGYTLTASSTPSYTAATSAAFNIGTSSGWTTYLQGNDRTGFTSDSGFNPTSVKNLHLAWQTSDTAPNHGSVPATGRVERTDLLGIERRQRTRDRYLREARVADEPGQDGHSILHRPLCIRNLEHSDDHD
jgi:hypothetical protein